MPDLRFIYFDLDDTLLDHRHAERQALAELCIAHPDHFGPYPEAQVQDVYHTHNVEVWRRYAAGDLTKDEAKRLRFEHLLAALQIDGLVPEVLGTDYLNRYACHWRYCEGARTAFLTLAAQFPVGVLTNGFSEVQHAKLDQFPELRAPLSALVISEEVGVLKPHPKLFAHATEAAGVPPAQILYVGDSYRSDVVGAQQAGWQMAWYTREAPPDTEVFHFAQWPTLLRWIDS